MTATLSETLTLLLIEDDDGDAFLVEELLRQAEAPPKITWVRSLAETRAKLTSEIQCVLVDLSLPDATGLEALEQVLAMAPHAAVLVLTGLRDVHVGWRPCRREPRTTWSSRTSTRGCWPGRSATRWSASGPTWPSVRLVEAELTAKENARLERRPAARPPAAHQGAWSTSRRYLPGTQGSRLAGDFLDTVQTPDGSVHVVVGDVCGHGPDEAALGVALRIAWRTLVLAGQSGDALLRTLDTLLRAERKAPEIFTTLCMATITPDLTHARMRVVGHPPPLLVRDGVIEVARRHAVRAAARHLPRRRVDGHRRAAGREWSMMLYTDGLIEAAVGEDRNCWASTGCRPRHASTARIDLDRLIRHVGTLSDDLAAMLVSRSGT